ncbi:MAG: histidine phosphatase family protein [Desulfomonilaceae bacterium]
MSRNSKKIILARHGQTVFNRDGFIQGRADSFLTYLGVPEVRLLPDLAKPENPSIIYASTLGRSAYTGSVYSQELSLPIKFRSSIVELSCGIWEGLRRSDVKGWFYTLRESWHDRPPKGESYEDAEDRVKEFVNEITDQEVHSSILVVAHAGLNRVFLKLWLQLEQDLARVIRCPHDTLYVLEPNGIVRRKQVGKSEERGFLFESE